MTCFNQMVAHYLCYDYCVKKIEQLYFFYFFFVYSIFSYFFPLITKVSITWGARGGECQ